MQASTGAVYDVDTDLSGQIFSSATRHINPAFTNLNDNQFEVNEALLVENISFYICNAEGTTLNFMRSYGSAAVLVFDLIIGNKRVMKDTPVFAAGSPYTFANVANGTVAQTGDPVNTYLPRNQVYMEGAGVLIPPQVQWYVEYRIFDLVTGAIIAPTSATQIGCYLYGTKVLLNFNTSI
jgi:hypothetical protein